MYKVGLDTFGKKVRKNEDLFNARIKEMEPAIITRCVALLEYKDSPLRKH